MLIALMPELGFSGMEEADTVLLAYSNSDEADFEALDTVVSEMGLTYEREIVEEQNWNEVWESNFDPVILPGLIHIRAFFHPPLEGFRHEILITPKMSFGTGHHATTRMMLKAMVDMDFNGKKVLDFGTGTGILAILSVKLGAKSVIAIDNDSWSIDNVKENILLNNADTVEVLQGSSPAGLPAVDIVLANINRNVLEGQVHSIDGVLLPGGMLFISGLLQEDYDSINRLYCSFFGQPIVHLHESEWIALVYQKAG